jgi:hypothetical protein
MKPTESAPRLGLLVLGLLLAGCGSSSTRQPPTDIIAAAGLDTRTIPATWSLRAEQERLVLYPNAQGVRVDNPDTGNRAFVTFTTSDSYQDVFAFYKDALAKQGWVFVAETTYLPSLTFVWKDAKALLPWNLRLHINTERAAGAPQLVTLSLQRWPDASRIPLYPGAQAATEAYAEDPRDNRFPSRVTHFLVRAAPEEVARYYNQLLPEQGWNLDSPGDPNILIQTEVGLEFGYLRDNGGLGTGAHVLIRANPAPDGLTQVELRVQGDGIHLPGTQEQEEFSGTDVISDPAGSPVP